MNQAISFICEHTAEYTLVPELKKILRNKFDIVVPIYPWALREGGNISKEIHRNDKFKMVGLYPRRPKLFSANNPTITIKINDQIIIGAQKGLKLGIPIVAGCPLVNNFWGLGNKPKCVWIKLDQGFKETLELQFEQAPSGIYYNQKSSCIFPNENSLLKYLGNNSETTDIESVIASFKQIKSFGTEIDYYSSFRFMGFYKPVYFLLK